MKEKDTTLEKERICSKKFKVKNKMANTTDSYLCSLKPNHKGKHKTELRRITLYINQDGNYNKVIDIRNILD